MVALSRFHNLHAGRRGVIVCNGPSLNRMDLGFLRQEIVIGLNKIHLGLDRFGFYPRYLVAVNALVVAQARAEIAAMTCIKFIAARSAADLPQDAFTHHIPILGPPVVFSTDIAHGVREGGTVTHAALQIAYYMGFSEVVIIGMDHRYDFTGKPHQAVRLEGPDTNHFSPDYFSGQTWQNPDLRRSEDFMPPQGRPTRQPDGRSSMPRWTVPARSFGGKTIGDTSLFEGKSNCAEIPGMSLLRAPDSADRERFSADPVTCTTYGCKRAVDNAAETW